MIVIQKITDVIYWYLKFKKALYGPTPCTQSKHGLCGLSKIHYISTVYLCCLTADSGLFAVFVSFSYKK